MKLPQDIITDKIKANGLAWARNFPRIPQDKIITNIGRPILMNRKCMFNALNECKAGHAVCIVEVVECNHDPIAHYINMDADGMFYDITLGWSWSGGEYRIVRYISSDSEEARHMGEVLASLKKRLYEQSPKWLRSIHRGDHGDTF